MIISCVSMQQNTFCGTLMFAIDTQKLLIVGYVCTGIRLYVIRFCCIVFIFDQKGIIHCFNGSTM